VSAGRRELAVEWPTDEEDLDHQLRRDVSLAQ
jgi:hypothetical protein